MNQQDCSNLAEFEAMPSNQDRQRFLESVQYRSTGDNVGRSVSFGGCEWTIAGINYLGDYDIERYDDRGMARSSCRLGLPAWHPHHATLLDSRKRETT